ncbi:hypothetical protein [Nocardia wallacei]|uniref:hypothetical protein n=1 Tax=Nocardia wallacei TaxID=480035 RepID=UPI00245485FB|nr:hypothetical protein [Nocardia wallacei]
MTTEIGSSVIGASIDAARAVARGGAGLVLVLRREGQTAAVLHWQVGADVSVAEPAATVRADEAVLIVVGSPRAAAPLIAAVSTTYDQLDRSRVAVRAVLHVRRIESGAAIWDLMGAADGIVTDPEPIPEPRGIRRAVSRILSRTPGSRSNPRVPQRFR